MKTFLPVQFSAFSNFAPICCIQFCYWNGKLFTTDKIQEKKKSMNVTPVDLRARTWKLKKKKKKLEVFEFEKYKVKAPPCSWLLTAKVETSYGYLQEHHTYYLETRDLGLKTCQRIKHPGRSFDRFDSKFVSFYPF